MISGRRVLMLDLSKTLVFAASTLGQIFQERSKAFLQDFD